MSINSNITNQDSGKPADFVNSTYDALKYNPQATQQTLQKGQAAGLAGLGAMAAQRFQQRAQESQQTQQAAAFGQNPQPTILQQLQMAAMQGGIMGQLTGNIQMAQAPQAPQAPQGSAGLADIPVDPNALPQTMAGGGLVALAQGGYLDADGGMGYEPTEGYAHGGEVRGFAAGEEVELYNPTQSPWDYIKDAGTRLSDTLLPGYEDYRNKMEKLYDEDVAEDDDSLLDEQAKYYATTEPSPSMLRQLRGGRNGEIPTAHESVKNTKAPPIKEAQKIDKDVKATLKEDAHLAERALPDVDYGRGVTKMVSQEGARSPEAEEQIQEARDLRQAEQAPVQQGGLPSIQAQGQTATPGEGDIMALIDKIKTARGVPAAMSQEERAWREEKAKDANTEKWLQTLTGMAGGLFAGGGRNWPEAIGQGALYGLSAYRQGAAAESEAELSLLNRQAQVQEAQRKAQEEAADKYYGVLSERGKLGSAESIARSKVLNDRTLAEYKAENKAREKELDRKAAYERALVIANDRGDATQAQLIQTRTKAQDDAKEALIGKYGALSLVPPGEIQVLADELYAQYLRAAGMTPPGLGGGQGIAGGQGLGNRTVIMRSGIQSPASS